MGPPLWACDFGRRLCVPPDLVVRKGGLCAAPAWLTFNVGQKKMNSKLLYDFGRCVLEAQVVEFYLSILFLLERDKRTPRPKEIDAFVASLVALRSDCCISVLGTKLRGLGVPSTVLADLPQVVKRRNHLAHRIVHDAGFLRALGSPSDSHSFDDDLRLFTTCRDRIEEHFFARAVALNVPVLRSPTSSVEQICGFADRVLDGIQRKRKEK